MVELKAYVALIEFSETIDCLRSRSIAEAEGFAWNSFKIAVSQAVKLERELRCARRCVAKWVDVRAELVPEVIRVSVTDEGPGFDPETIPEPILPEQLDGATGRGLFLIRKLVDTVQFNARGNSICMILRRP